VKCWTKCKEDLIMRPVEVNKKQGLAIDYCYFFPGRY
jgi:hypothetical protein